MKKDYYFVSQVLAQPNELTIEIPEGQEIDWQESAKQEKIVFKKKDTKPRSWEEYCKNIPFKKGNAFIETDCRIIEFNKNVYFSSRDPLTDKNVLPNKKLAEAFLAMMQLMSLRQAWIGDWEPDWNDVNKKKAYIRCGGNELDVSCVTRLISRPLSFPSREMAEEFLDCFKDLLEIAKPLI